MVMRLSLARASVDVEGGGSWEEAAVSTTREGRLLVREKGSGAVLLDVVATAVQPGGRDKTWTVQTEVGAVTVERAPGCGCGG